MALLPTLFLTHIHTQTGLRSEGWVHHMHRSPEEPRPHESGGKLPAGHSAKSCPEVRGRRALHVGHMQERHQHVGSEANHSLHGCDAWRHHSRHTVPAEQQAGLGRTHLPVFLYGEGVDIFLGMCPDPAMLSSLLWPPSCTVHGAALIGFLWDTTQGHWPGHGHPAPGP